MIATPSQPASPQRGCLLSCRLDVLIVAKQIRGVVLRLQCYQTRIVGAVGRPDLVGTVFVLASDVVDANPTSGAGPQGLPQLPGPAHVALRLLCDNKSHGMEPHDALLL